MSTLTLASLAVGQRSIVERVRGTSRVSVRLMELGLVAGTKVALERRAPLGDPIEVSVRGYRLSLRAEEANSVLVRLETLDP